MVHEKIFRIYDGLDEFSPLIGQFCGIGQFPQSIVGTSGQSFANIFFLMYTLTHLATFFIQAYFCDFFMALTIKFTTKRLIYLRILQNHWRKFSLIFCLFQKKIASNVEKKIHNLENNAASMEHLHSVK
jgi:hypothetical protein